MDTCTVDTCTNPVKRTGYCYGHYMKNWRYGTPTPEHAPTWDDVRGQRFGTLTVTNERIGRFWVCLCDCGRTAKRDVGNLRRTGDASTCGTPCVHYRSDDPRYRTVHDRVKRMRGPASKHRCVDCGERAQHWSYDHEDPDELYAIGVSKEPVAYSKNAKHYHARCVPCHKRYDLDRANSTFSRA